MKYRSMLLLRVSMGILMLLWGIDKLINVDHSARVAESFYLGVGSQEMVLRIFGVLEIALGVLVVLGLLRVFAYPALIAILRPHGARRVEVDPRSLGMVSRRQQRPVLSVADHLRGVAGALVVRGSGQAVAGREARGGVGAEDRADSPTGGLACHA